MVMHVEKTNPEARDWYTDVPSLARAGKVSFGSIVKNLKDLERMLLAAQSEYRMTERRFNEHDQFKEKLERFVDVAETNMTQCSKMYSDFKGSLRETVAYFCEDLLTFMC